MINNNLKFCREELEMTQEELGFVFGVSRKTISGWETATDPIPFSKLVKFCSLYNYSIDFALGLIRKNIDYIKNILEATNLIDVKLGSKELNNICKKIDNCGIYIEFCDEEK